MTLFGSIDDSNIKYTGPEIPELGISSGDDLNAVLGTLINSVKGKNGLTPITGSEVRSAVSTAPLGGSSLAVSKIAQRAFNYSVVKDGDGATVIYDFSAVQNALPAGYEPLAASANFVDNEGKRSDTRGSSGQQAVKNFPVKADFTLGVRTPSGDIEMKTGAVIMNNASDSKTAIFDARDFTNANSSGDNSVDENFELLIAEVSEMKKKIQTLESLNLPVELEVLKQATSS
jgi:hypothetical protein